MANLILVMGKTKSGKSTAIKNLDPVKTYIINPLDKDLPFKGGRSLYSREKKNIKAVNNWKEVVNILNALPKASPEVDTVIIDDIRHIMEAEFIERALEIGYGKFTQLGQHMIEVFKAAKGFKDNNSNVYMLFHTDDVYNDKNLVTYKAKLVGKLVEEHFDPMELVTISLVTCINMDEDKIQYQFATNRTNFNGVEIPAGSPEGMFDLFIPNDYDYVNKKIKEYYGTETN